MTATYDPERRLWVPGRRRFLLLSGLAMAGTVLGVKPWAPVAPPEIWIHTRLLGRDGSVLEWSSLAGDPRFAAVRDLSLGDRIAISATSSPHVRELVVAEMVREASPFPVMASMSTPPAAQWWKLSR